MSTFNDSDNKSYAMLTCNAIINIEAIMLRTETEKKNTRDVDHY